MPLFLLVRHGENEYVKSGRMAGRLPGVHLNENGRKQAQRLAEQLSHAPVKALFSSPLERAIETAEPIAQAVGLAIVESLGLIETDCGEWQDQKIKGLSRTKIWKLLQTTPSIMRFPGGESVAEGQRRIVAELEALASKFEPKDMLVCVSHADPIKLAIAHFIGLPLDLFQRLSISPGSISAIWIGLPAPRLVTLNFDPSLTFSKG